ncbi:hypothetical protein SD70_00770 [Gordoniibacillus kamchatkensis]|uniref:Uncharacterized protein n=1 Tax=Gordoniibacillus kamchatkensis TaxID=1590651 RepID=A0ABR5AND1_9BACL|nr:hypothetical protein [Paenibacillus sp. VKM B-2647]KIL42470.1 hypothetical protein SD70_00770 [Paenibacillus sp. VKM B-2647]
MILRRIDTVTIRFAREPITGVRTIAAVRIVGSAAPCLRLLVVGKRLIPAVNCLLRSGFVLVAFRGNVLVFRRRKRRRA